MLTLGDCSEICHLPWTISTSTSEAVTSSLSKSLLIRHFTGTIRRTEQIKFNFIFVFFCFLGKLFN